MIGITVAGLLTAGGVVGALVLAAAAAARFRSGRAHKDGTTGCDIEVLGRVGVHTNQAVAVVRVARRTLVVSCGDGGVRLIAELSEADFPSSSAVPRRSSVGVAHHDAKARWIRKIAFLPGWFFFCVTVPQLSAQVVPEHKREEEVERPSVVTLLEALPPVSIQVGADGEALRLTGPVGTVVVMGVLALAPSLLLLTTSFTRILVVLHLLRHALGTQNTPPAHLLSGLALLLSAIVMSPTIETIRQSALDPWLAGDIDHAGMLRAAFAPVREFMLVHTRDSDLATFLAIDSAPTPATPEGISGLVLASAFVTSELRTAFEIGFAVFVPFVVIDLAVAAVLTSMGMFMLPPTMVALPCKLLVFVLMDGWSLVLGTLAQSFM